MAEKIAAPNRWEQVDDALQKVRSLLSALRDAGSNVPDINNSLEAAMNLAYLICEDAEHPQQVQRYAALLEEQLAIMAAITRPKLRRYEGSVDIDGDRAELGSNGES